METELKLKVPAADLERLRSHPMLQAHSREAPVEHHLIDTYYDTPQRNLWKHGLMLRVRRDNEKWIQTVKTAATASAALHERGEWECELPDGAPNPGLLVRQIKQARIAKLLASKEVTQHLQPVFQNTTHRTTWNIALPTGEQLECALDAGDIACGKQHTAISELELELKDGNPARLFDLALELHHDVPLQMSNDSKAALGYAMLDNEAIRIYKAAPVHLFQKMTLEDAFQAIALNCLQQIETNLPGVLKQNVESLHQMRVGLRRLRALLNMFEELAPLPPALRDDVDWLAGELGTTRDWDVLADSTLNHIPGFDADALREAAKTKSTEAHKLLVKALRSPQFTRVMLELNGWLYGQQWRIKGALPHESPLGERVKKAASPLLRKAEKRLAKRIKALDTADPHARHSTRIAAKKARYAAEFFEELLPRKHVKPYVTHLSKLQDRLGLLNDIAVAEHLLDQFNGSNAQVARQAAYAHGYLAAASSADAATLRKPLAAVAKLRMTH
ncbi:CYTH and CHAD domain-containing protein [Massilia putida]|uniref:CYTH and CHAD domain-containing protein n=1 Tax=Massilia putida TaxID=1141883 RepID=UPI000950EABF|nr:CYTH and CHAD domain-containing protein [Massilia putida]